MLVHQLSSIKRKLQANLSGWSLQQRPHGSGGELVCPRLRMERDDSCCSFNKADFRV